MVRSKAPTRYITQPGVACWAGSGGLGGGGLGGGDCGAGGGLGDDSGIGGGLGDDSGAGCDSVVKAPTALQALCVLEPLALTFQ